MATRQYIAAKLREFAPDLADDCDEDVIAVANTCQCGRESLFSPDEIDAFIARSETAREFLRRVYLSAPKTDRC